MFGFYRWTVGAFLVCGTCSGFAQDGIAQRTLLGTSLADDGSGIDRYREDTGWSSANYDNVRWGVNYGTPLRTSPWASVLQSDRTNATFTADANQLVLDLAGHTYTILPYMAGRDTVKGGLVTISDGHGTGASLTVVNGTFTNTVIESTTTVIAKAGETGRLTVADAEFRSSKVDLGSKSGASGYLILDNAGVFKVRKDLDIGVGGQGSVELRGAGSSLTAAMIFIGGNSGVGSIVVRDPTARFIVDGSTGFGDMTINNHASGGLTPGLRVDAGTVEIDDKLILGSNTGSGVVTIQGGSVSVGGPVKITAGTTDTTGGKLFLRSGRLEVDGPVALTLAEDKQFYWEGGTLAFRNTETSLTEAQLRRYTKQGAVTYGGERAAGSLAGTQVLESAGTLTLSGGSFGLNGGTIRAATELIVDANLAGYGTLDAVVSGAGAITNATSSSLAIGALSGAISLDSSGEVHVGGRGVDATYSGTSTGTGSFVKIGSATQTITGSIANEGGVRVEQGTLAFKGSGQRLSTSSFEIANGAVARFAEGAQGTASLANIGHTPTPTDLARLEIAGVGSSLTVTGDLTNRGWIDIDGGTLQVEGSLVNHGTLINDGTLVASVSGAGSLSGSGSFDGSVIVADGAALAPGNSPGEMTFTDLTLGPGGIFEFELAAATGIAGEQWDLAIVSGVLSIAATAADPYRVVLQSLDGSFQPGTLDGFDPTQSYSWQFLAASIANPNELDLAAFQLETSSFVSFNDLAGGDLSLVAASDGLYVSFAPQLVSAPEPGSAVLLIAVGSIAGLVRCRRGRTKTRPRTREEACGMP